MMAKICSLLKSVPPTLIWVFGNNDERLSLASIIYSTQEAYTQELFIYKYICESIEQKNMYKAIAKAYKTQALTKSSMYKIFAIGQKILVSFPFTFLQLHTTTTIVVCTPIYLASIEWTIHFSEKSK